MRDRQDREGARSAAEIVLEHEGLFERLADVDDATLAEKFGKRPLRRARRIANGDRQ